MTLLRRWAWAGFLIGWACRRLPGRGPRLATMSAQWRHGYEVESTKHANFI